MFILIIMYMIGTVPNLPLVTPVVETVNPPLSIGLTQQTMWGALTSFPNSATVRNSLYIMLV